MDSIETLNEYLKRESVDKSDDTSLKEERQARAIVVKVTCANGNTMVEKAKNAGVDYKDFMTAQRLLCRKD